MIKKNIFWFILIFFMGFFVSQLMGNVAIFEQNKNEKIDFSFLNEVKSKLDEKFVDTREDKTKEITKDDMVFGAASGLVASYGDIHTMFFPPKDGEEFIDDLSGEFSGIGVEITNQKGFLTVVSPLPDTPGYRAGLQPKDVIIEIDGKNSIHMSSREAVKLIRGKEGTEVELKVARKGEPKPITVKIKRGKIKIPVVKTFIEDDVFVVKFYSFTENSPKVFYNSVVPKFKRSGLKKMILDLRGNSGGFLQAGVFISGIFLPEGEIIVKEDHQGKEEDKEWVAGNWHLNPENTTNILKDIQLGILVDGGTASASEILAGALSDYKKAILLGTKTFGKGTVQQLVDFSNGASLKVTIAKFILPNGEWISYKGIRPDVEIKLDKEEILKMREKGSFTNYVDNQLKEAVKYLSKIRNQKEFQEKVEEFAKKRKEYQEKDELDELLDEKK